MSEPLCRPCGDTGQSVRAHRIVGKTPMCDTHFRSAMGMPAAVPNGHNGGSQTMDKATEDAIRKDAATEMSVEQIRKKHGVSWYNAKKVIDGANGTKAAGGGANLGLRRNRLARRTGISRSRLLRREWMRFGTRCSLRRKRSC